MAWNAAQQAAIDRVSGGSGYTDGLTEEQRKAIKRAEARAAAQPTTYSDEFGNIYTDGPAEAAEPESRGLGGTVADFTTGVAAAVPRAVGGIVSLGSLVPGVNVVADPLAEALMDAGDWVDERFLSDYQKNINTDMAQAMADSAKQLDENASITDHLDNIASQGGAAAKFVAKNPSQALMLAGQAIPYLIGGGALARTASAATKGVQTARGVTATGLTPAVAGATGEGLMAAGAVEAEIVGKLRDEGTTEYTAGRLAAIPAGVATSLIGLGGARLNAKLGIADVDTAVAGQSVNLVAEAPKKGLVKGALTGSVSEGVEELFQSGSEQAFTNLGTGDPLSEDVGSSAVFGAAAGAPIGSVAGAFGNSGTDLNKEAAERDAQEQLLVEAEQTAEAQKVEDLRAQQEQAALTDQKQARRQVAAEFPLADYEKAQTAQQALDIDDPATELGQAFEAHLDTLPGTDGIDPAKITKAKTKYLKGYQEGTAETLEQEYLAELDARVAALAQAPVDPRQGTFDFRDTPAPAAGQTGQLNLDLGDTPAAPSESSTLDPEQERQRETDTPAQSRKDAITQTERLLGADWVQSGKYGDLASAINGKAFTRKKYAEALKAAVNPQATPEVGPDGMTPQGTYRSSYDTTERNNDKTSVNTLAEGGTTEEAAQSLKDPKALKLSVAQDKIFKVLDDHLTGDKKYAMDEVFAGGQFLDTNIAKLAGVKNKQHVATSIDRFKTKFLEAQGLLKPRASKAEKDAAVAAYKERLRQEADEAKQAKIKASQEAATAEDAVDADISQTADTADAVDIDPNSAGNLGDVSDDGEGSASIFAEVGIDSTVASVGQGNYSETSATNAGIAESNAKSKQAYKAANKQERKAVAERNELGRQQAEEAGTEFTPEEFKPVKDLTAKQIQEFAQKQTTSAEEVAVQAAEQNAKNLQRNINYALQEVSMKTVVAEWNALKSDDTPAITKLSKQDVYDWMMSVIEYEMSVNPSLEQLTADLREIEQRLTESANETQTAENDEGPTTQSSERSQEARAPPEGSQGKGSAVNASAGADTSTSGSDGIVQGAAPNAPVVERKPKKRVVKKPEKKSKEAPLVKAREASDEQITQADALANDVNGTVVYQRGDVSLARGYAVSSGDPVYMATKGSKRTRTDIESFTGKLFTAEERNQLVEAKKADVEAANKKHKEAPFVVFKDGMAFSSSIKPELSNVLAQWKKTLGIDADIYFTTTQDARADKDNLTGPQRAVGSSTMNSNEGGAARKLSDGSHYVVFKDQGSKAATLEVLGHEIGHVHQKVAFDKAPKETQDALRAEHKKWVASQKGKTGRELVDSLRARKTGKTTAVAEGAQADQAGAYWTSFNEWYADQVSRWATTSETPLTIVEKFFAKIGAAMKRFYNAPQNKKYFANERFVEYLEGVKNVSTRTQTKLTGQSSRATTTRKARDTFASEALDSMYLGFDTVEQGLDYITRTGNKFEKQLSKRLKEIAALGDYAYVVVDPAKPTDTLKREDFEPVDSRISSSERRALGARNLKFASDEWTKSVEPPQGLYVAFGAKDVDQANGVVMLNGDSDNGLTNSTFLHEMLHAVTQQTIDRVRDGDLTSGPAYQLYKEIEALTQAVDRKSQGVTAKQLSNVLNVSEERATNMKWVNDEAVKLDVHEFIAYAFTDSSFQTFLNTLEVSSGKSKPASIWRRFVNAVQSFMGTELGFTSPKGETALERVMTLTDAMLDERVAMQANQVAQRRGVAPNMSATMNPKITKQQGDWAVKFMGPKAKPFLANAKFIAKAGVRSLKFLHQIVEENRETIPAVGRWYDAMLAAEATRNEIRRQFEDIALRATQLEPARMDAVNDFIGKSTFFQKWGYDPKIDGKTVKVDPIMKRAFDSLNENEQQLAKDVFAHGENMRQRKIAIAKALGVSGKFFTEAALDGPYAPLKRFGNFAGELKSQQLVDAEAKRKALDPKAVTKELRDKINELKSDPDHYAISFFDTPGAAEQFVDANKNKYAFAQSSERDASMEEDRMGNPAVYEKVLGALKADDKAKIDPEAKKAFQDMVKNLYFQSLDERSARLSGARRMSRAGYDKNMMRSFLSHARAEASLISQMENGTEVNTAFAEVAQQVSDNRPELGSTGKMIVRHYKDTLNQVETPVQDRIAAANSVYMLTTSIGYHVTNATQPIMVTVPRIAGDFNNYTGTWASLFKGYGVARKIIDGSFFNQVKTAATVGMLGDNQVGIDVSKAPPEYRKLLEYLQLHQLLDVGMEEDLGMLDKFDTGNAALNKASDFLGGITHRLYQVARYVEAHNRISSAIAAYDMANKNRGAVSRMKMTPLEYATSVVQDTQGNFSRLDAPLLLKALPKVMVQYRKYQFLMAWHYTNAFNRGFFGETPEVKATGKRVLRYSIAHAAMGAGATGVPLLGSVYWALTTMLGDEDEPEDLERYIRSKVEDEKLADVLTRGLPAFLGLDMSTKLSQGKIFQPLPYVDFEASDSGAKDVFFGAFAGPAGTTGVNFFRAAGYMQQGDMLKAVEYSVPKGVRSATETFRLATEGYSLKNGDIVIDPREINMGSLLVNAMGLPSTEINKIKWTRGQQYELTEYFSQESSRIRKEFIEARRDRDRTAQKALREEWRELQASKDRIRPFFNNERGTLKRQSVSDLMKAPRRQSKREDKYRMQLTGN